MGNKVFWYGVALCVFLCVWGAVPVAADGDGWANKQAKLIGLKQIQSAEAKHACPGRQTVIAFQQTHFQPACVYGTDDASRLARYTDENGWYRYAFASKQSMTFYPLTGFCERRAYCLYSQSTDTLLFNDGISMGVGNSGYWLVNHFSKRLSYRTTDNGSYTLIDYSGYSPLGLQQGVYPSGAASISRNGDWIVVELHDYGFIRVNVKTKEARRFAAPGARYGLMNDPSFEIAIDNSGRHVAVVGLRAGIDVYEIDETCGDSPENILREYFNSPTKPCATSSIERNAAFPGFISAHDPVFSPDAAQLSLSVATQSGIYAGVLSPTLPLAIPGYFAYGDSFTSGEGEMGDEWYLEGTNTNTNHCHVSSRSYPYLLGAAWEYLTVNQACSGATVDDARNVVFNSTNMQSASWAPVLVTISVGGNDAGIMDKLKTCLGMGECEWVKVENRAKTANEIERLIPKLTQLFMDTKQQHAYAKLVVVGYPSVVEPDANFLCASSTGILLSGEERRFLSASLTHLNKVLQVAASYAKITYVSVEDAFYGQRLCEGDERAMNGVRAGDDIAPIPLLSHLKVIGAESFHPTPYGHEKIAVKLAEKSNDLWAEPCGTCTTSIERSDYWSEPSNTPVTVIQQLRKTFIETKDIVEGALMQLKLADGIFSARSLVKIELHSNVVELTTLTSNDDGGLATNVSLPAGITGYHTIVLKGVDELGNPTEVYQVLYIKPDTRSSGVVNSESKGILESPVAPTGAEHNVIHSVDNAIDQSKVSDSQHFALREVQGLSTTRQDVSGVLLLVGLGCSLIGVGSIFYWIYKRRATLNPP